MRENLGIAIGVSLMLSTITIAPATAGPFDGETIRVQFWGGSDGLVIRKNIVDPFVKATGARVIVEEGNTSASIAKVRAQKSDPQLDVIFCDDIGILTLAREDVLDKLDLSKMPHAKEIHPAYIVGGGYGIGIFNYITTVLYNPQITKAPTSWNDLWKPELRGKVLMADMAGTSGLLQVVMAAQLNGGSLDNLDPAWPKLEQLKPNIHSYILNRALASEALKSGEAVYAIDTPYYFKPYIDRGYPIAMTTDLKEGFFSITGGAAVVKGGKGKREVVYAFIDQALNPEAQAALAKELWYGPTNPNAKLSPEEEKYMVHTPEQFSRALQVDRLKLLEKREGIIQKYNATMK